MDFLDSLENSLKNLERQEERDPGRVHRLNEARKQEQEKAPWAEKLKKSPFTAALLNQAALAGHRLRSKIYVAWIDNVLRLEVRGRWCELRPMPTGIECEFIAPDGGGLKREIALSSNPEDLLFAWLGKEAFPER